MRAGFTVLEMAVGMAVGAMIVGLAGQGLSALLRAQRGSAVPGQAVDLVCDRLRRDLSAGAHVDGADLVAGGARWSPAPARDGRPCAGVRAIAWRRDGGAWEVVLTPEFGPPRTLRVVAP